MDSPARTTSATGTTGATDISAAPVIPVATVVTFDSPRLGLGSQPAYAVLIQFPVACFVGALLTDLAYVKTLNYIWETFSIWLLTAGCIFGGLAGLAGLITWISHRHVRATRFAGLYVVTCLAAFILAIVNTFIHSRDGYAAVMPLGLTLSVVVVVLMVLATWLGWPRVHYAQRPAGVL